MTPELFDPDKIFHGGEIAVQERTNSRAIVERYGNRLVRPYMPDQHRQFFELLPFIVAGMADSQGRVWATLSTGEPGFVSSPNEKTLEIRSPFLMGEKLDLPLLQGEKVGLLGIELPTRRRNRMNGIIKSTEGGSMTVEVDQSFGNCPKYIQTREITLRKTAASASSSEISSSSSFTADTKKIIEKSDTFFIASRTRELNDDPRTGIDVSHRGGRPGFIRVIDKNRLEFPDFAGNRIFNTFGNIEDDGRVGLIFTDFDTGDAVFLTGRAEVIWDEARINSFKGAERLVEVEAEEVWHAPSILPFRAELHEPWPPLSETGTWADYGLT